MPSFLWTILSQNKQTNSPFSTFLEIVENKYFKVWTVLPWNYSNGERQSENFISPFFGKKMNTWMCNTFYRWNKLFALIVVANCILLLLFIYKAFSLFYIELDNLLAFLFLFSYSNRHHWFQKFFLNLNLWFKK